MSENKAILVVGAGSGTGAEVAKRFAREGFVACVARRNADALADLVSEIEQEGGKARAFAIDATQEQSVIDAFNTIETEIGPVAVAVYNAAGFARSSITETSVETYHNMWAVGTLGGFIVGREAARRMVPRGEGTILYTGASASLRGNALFAAFAASKHAMRVTAQSMARELGPKGIHVAHVIIDGLIDVPRGRAMLGDDAYEKLGEHGTLKPENIAEAYWTLHRQSPSAWTFEMDLRPFSESW
ncbi:MAG: SDR family NAD(P)-dependent oxidoreductase [Myxococcota bacterium]